MMVLLEVKLNLLVRSGARGIVGVEHLENAWRRFLAEVWQLQNGRRGISYIIKVDAVSLC